MNTNYKTSCLQRCPTCLELATLIHVLKHWFQTRFLAIKSPESPPVVVLTGNFDRVYFYLDVCNEYVAEIVDDKIQQIKFTLKYMLRASQKLVGLN